MKTTASSVTRSASLAGQWNLGKSLHTSAKHFVTRVPLVKAAGLMLLNLVWRVRLSTGRIESELGSAHATRTLEQSLDYIEEVFADYKRYGHIERFAGRVAEIGPGDNAGVALLMRAAGCDQIDLIDRFLSRYDAQQQARICDSLARRYDLDSLRMGASWDCRSLSGITWRNGESSEKYFSECARQNPQTYDLIVSRAVLEHLQDPLACIRNMVECLKPGGRMLHKIDLRDHGMFSPVHDELAWLEIPSVMWKLMTSQSGHPNRVLAHGYREVLEDLKRAGLIDYSLLITSLVGAGDVAPHRPFEDVERTAKSRALAFVKTKRKRLAREFRCVASEDLATSGVFLIAERL